MRSRTGRPHGLRLLVTVTFNANQLRAHLLPLIALDEVESISLVADRPPPELPKVRAFVPSTTAQRTLGRAGAKRALLRRLTRAERFDWVVGFNFVPHGLNAIHVAKRTGIRSLYHMIGGPHEWLGGGYSGSNAVLSRLPRPVPALERYLLRQMREATLVATMGPRARDLAVSKGLEPARVVAIPPSTDTDRFRPAKTPRPYAAVCVSSLIGLKRTSDVLDALADLRVRHPGVRGAIAGDGPERPALEARARSLGIAEAVDFLGRVDRIEDLYGAARSFVLASEREGLSISMLDAMASGIPVVVSDVGEVRSAVEHGTSGLLFKPGDVAALAQHLDSVLTDDQLAETLGAGARRVVLDRYSIECVAAIYRQLLIRSESL